MSLGAREIEVYLFRRRGGEVQLLLLRRAPSRSLPGIWQPITGALQEGETIFAAAAREAREETGLESKRWWLLESPFLYFHRTSGGIRALPRFAAEIAPRDRVELSAEHDSHAFLSLDRAAGRVLWESQREALRQLRRQILRGGRLARALEIPAAAFRAAALPGEE